MTADTIQSIGVFVALIISIIGLWRGLRTDNADLSAKYLRLANDTAKKYQEQLTINQSQQVKIDELEKRVELAEKRSVEENRIGWRLYHQIKSRGDIPVATPGMLPGEAAE